MENTAAPVETSAKPEPTMVPASTEISAEANAKIEAFRAKQDRSRAYVLRQIIHEWAEKQPMPRKAKS